MEGTVQKITPFLWFDTQAEEAATLYTSLFPNSKVSGVRRYGDAGPGPKGQVMTLSFSLDGNTFSALNGGPVYSFTPAMSIFVTVPTDAEADMLWAKLSPGGREYMPLQEYPFSRRFGWLSDRFGLSWQVSSQDGPRTFSTYALFVGPHCGKGKEAIQRWTSLFEGSKVESIQHVGKGEGEPEGNVRVARFTLAGSRFMVAESALGHAFAPTPAFSLFVNCRTQAEVDTLWEKLSEGGAKSQCGWVTDAYGISWQVVPTVLGELMSDPDPAKVMRVTHAMLKMTRLDIAALQAAAKG